MNFGKVLSRSWNILWKYKVLWIFGFLGSCNTAYGSSSSNIGSRLSFEGGFFPFGGRRFVLPQVETLPNWQVPALVVLMILIVLVISVVFIFLSTIGRIGVIRGTQMVEEDIPSLSSGELFREGLRYFWRVFTLNFLFGLAVLILGGVIFSFFLGIGQVGLRILWPFILPLLCILIPIAWFLQVVIEQANVALIVEDLKIIEGFQRGWAVVGENIGAMLVMALILILGVGFIGTVLIGIPLGLVAFPFWSISRFGSEAARNIGPWTGILCLTTYLPVLLILSSILRAYTLSSWTLTFLQLSSSKEDMPGQAVNT